jgi:hypothetical protein
MIEEHMVREPHSIQKNWAPSACLFVRMFIKVEIKTEADPFVSRVCWRTDINMSECFNEPVNSRLITLPEGELREGGEKCISVSVL